MATSDISSKRAFDAVYAVFNKESKDRSSSLSFKTEIVLHTPVQDFTYKDGLTLREMIIQRDYETEMGDYIEVRITIPGGTFAHDIYEYAENLELTIRMHKQHKSKSSTPASEKPIISTERYKLVYLKDKNDQANNLKNYTREDLNQRLPMVLTWQILTRPVEAIRAKTTFGNFGRSPVTPDVFMRALMSTESDSIRIEGKPPLDIIDIQKADCVETIKDLTFMSHKRLIEIPDYLQEKSVGIYNSGLGCYIQTFRSEYEKYLTGFWMFSLFDPDNPVRTTPHYHVYCPESSNESSAYPASCFDASGKVLMLLAQKVSHIDDDKETAVMSSQSGFRVGDATKMLSEDAFLISHKGPIFSKKKLATEVIYKLRDDGVQHSTNHGNYANNLYLASEVMKRQSMFMNLLFNNLDHEYVGPAKTAAITYVAETKENGKSVKKTVSRHGLLVAATFKYSIMNGNPIMDLNSRYVEMQNVAELRFCIGEIKET